mmetsp:Transcript_31322/g.69135  ORF Transcript_31322/g.69135 Transcript_31322/m.69135 type:complete len:99 (+) Transcript_31322:41-337(+)
MRARLPITFESSPKLALHRGYQALRFTKDTTQSPTTLQTSPARLWRLVSHEIMRAIRNCRHVCVCVCVRASVKPCVGIDSKGSNQSSWSAFYSSCVCW